MGKRLNIYQLQEHIEQLNKLDDLLVLHKQRGGADADFMISQYNHRKEQVLKAAIAELVESNFENGLHEKMRLMHHLFNRFLTSENSSTNAVIDSEIGQLKALIS